MGGEDGEKIVRIPGETLLIKVSSEEDAYRRKYLPDPKKLTDEKLVCTVCSNSLAQNIHKGKDLFVHRALQVLVCENCYTFYGDGCFSADEDGDDKYCRWCGQGGTLYICSGCNCAFCEKCTKQNLKASVLADLENDDWKCYICNPRPLFGCRTICWGAQQLNKIGKEKEQERLKKVKERLEKMEARKKENSERKPRKVVQSSASEDEAPTKKRKRSSDGDSLSPEIMPKKRNRESRGNTESKNLNGSIGRRRKDSSTDSEDDKKVKRRSRNNSKKEKVAHSSSEDELYSKSKKEKLKKKKKTDYTSDESSDSRNKKTKRRSVKKKDSSEDESSEDEKSKKKKKLSVKKRDESTDSSDDGKKKKKLKKKKKTTSSEDSSGGSKKKIKKKKVASSSNDSSDTEGYHKSHKKTKSKPANERLKKQENFDNSDSDLNKGKKVTTDSEEVNSNSAEDILVKKRIKLAVLWLNTIVKDISELGTLISIRATKFSKKKINAESLKSYEDVLNCVSKIKQLVSGVHSNYDHIEKTLDSHLKPWKILTGLEDPDNEKNIVDGNSSVAVGNVSKSNETSTSKSHENKDTAHDIEVNSALEESKVENITEKNEEHINNWTDDSDDQNETRAMVSKANELLEKSQNENEETEKNNSDKKNGDNTKKDNEITNEEDFKPRSDVDESKEKSKPNNDQSAESKLETPKKNVLKINKDAKGSSEKSSKSTELDSDIEKRSPKKSLPVKSESIKKTNEEESKVEDKKEEIKFEG